MVSYSTSTSINFINLVYIILATGIIVISFKAYLKTKTVKDKLLYLTSIIMSISILYINLKNIESLTYLFFKKIFFWRKTKQEKRQKLSRMFFKKYFFKNKKTKISFSKKKKYKKKNYFFTHIFFIFGPQYPRMNIQPSVRKILAFKIPLISK